MKLALYYFSFFILTTLAHSQETGLILKLSGSASYSYRSLSNNSAFDYIDNLIAIRNEIELPLFVHSSSIGFGVRLKSKLELGLELGYSIYGEKALDVQPFPSPAPMSEFEGSTLKRFYDFYRYSLFISLPIIKKKSFIISAKTSPSLLYFHQIRENYSYTFTSLGEQEDEVNTSSKDAIGDANLYNASFSLGLELVFFQNKKVSLRVEPYFDHLLFQIFDAPVRQYCYKGGLNLGVNYSLKKISRVLTSVSQ